jgi:phage tail sheath protein FI
VYIQEVPSGVRTITGVATSITAFVGRALSGPTHEPIFITSYADYERRFGGLAVDSTMSYAVRDFFANQGSQAIIVRVTHDDAVPATVTLAADGSPADELVLVAANPGTWGNRLRVTVDHGTDADTPPGSPPGSPPFYTKFNLTVEYRVPDREAQEERFLNVSVDETSPRFLTRVLADRSSLLRVKQMPTGMRPPQAVAVGEGGNDGGDVDATDLIGNPDLKSGIYALNRADLFNLLCIPPPVRGSATPVGVYQKALTLCVDRRAFLVVDPDPAWAAPIDRAIDNAIQGREALGIAGPEARNGALYFPAIRQLDPLRDNQVDDFVPCGVIAGVMARTDATRGVWKAPAGLDAALAGVQGLQLNLSDPENGRLNPLGINCLRSFPVNGRVVWGARTLRGADQAADEYKYIPVRRLALFIEESLYRGTQWVVFEPNDEPLWAQIRLNVGAFMQNLFRQGAFQGRSPREAYLVKCDAETTTQNDINLGIVNILVGFAPLKPAEFVIIRIQQLAGQVQA